MSMSKHEGFSVPAVEALYKGCHVVIRRGTAADEFGLDLITHIEETTNLANLIEIITSHKKINFSTSKGFIASKNILLKSSDTAYLDLFKMLQRDQKRRDSESIESVVCVNHQTFIPK